MSSYIAPIADILFTAQHQFPVPGIDTETLDAIVQEAGKLAANIFAPLNWPADRQGAQIGGGTVKTPDGFCVAYRNFIDGGWNGLTAAEVFGGQGLPPSMGLRLQEIWQAANISLALCPLLTQGAIELLQHLGTERQKTLYLPKLVSGEWTGTMNLTEPQAGSDVGAVRASAERDGAHYRLRGQKIYISYGDHDLTENIIHLVLARLPGAPEGTKGLSLFLVPKIRVQEDGTLGAANDVKALSLEHKLGQHGSPTCVMQYGEHAGAYAEIVGAEQDGIRCMFIMMNNARLGVGAQGLGLCERALQQARAYARDRVQSKDMANPKGAAVPIIRHPDVRRMLLRMQSQIYAARALLAQAGAALDAGDTLRADLLTPIVKAWLTDLANEITSLNIQIHGGMGFIEETGAAQHYRDARVLAIYEGTNAIQANDLVFRKLARDDGAELKRLVRDYRDMLGDAMPSTLQAALEGLLRSAALVQDLTKQDARLAAGIAAPFLRQMALCCAGALLAHQKKLAESIPALAADFRQQKMRAADYFIAHILPEATAEAQSVHAGAQGLLNGPDEAF